MEGTDAGRADRTTVVAFGALVLLLVLSVIAGEQRIVPLEGSTWLSLAYLVTLGTIAVFRLFLYLTKHWQASSVSCQFVLTPFVGVVLVGVYVGALANR